MSAARSHESARDLPRIATERRGRDLQHGSTIARRAATPAKACKGERSARPYYVASVHHRAAPPASSNGTTERVLPRADVPWHSSRLRLFAERVHPGDSPVATRAGADLPFRCHRHASRRAATRPSGRVVRTRARSRTIGSRPDRSCSRGFQPSGPQDPEEAMLLRRTRAAPLQRAALDFRESNHGASAVFSRNGGRALRR